MTAPRALSTVRGRSSLLAAIGASSCTLPGRVEGPVKLTAMFDDVGDLVPGHSVQVADVRVGSITGIELTDDYKAKVTMRIKDGLELPANSEAVLRTTSLLGEKFVELRPPRRCRRRRDPVTGGILSTATSSSRPRRPRSSSSWPRRRCRSSAGVVSNDLSTLIETGAVGFGGRAAELGSLIDSLSVVSGTLADQTDNIVTHHRRARPGHRARWRAARIARPAAREPGRHHPGAGRQPRADAPDPA